MINADFLAHFAIITFLVVLACSLLFVPVAYILLAKQNARLIKTISTEIESRGKWIELSAQADKRIHQWDEHLADETDKSFGRLDYVAAIDDESEAGEPDA